MDSVSCWIYSTRLSTSKAIHGHVHRLHQTVGDWSLGMRLAIFLTHTKKDTLMFGYLGVS